jgi:hypothetical protein
MVALDTPSPLRCDRLGINYFCVAAQVSKSSQLLGSLARGERRGKRQSLPVASIQGGSRHAAETLSEAERDDGLVGAQSQGETSGAGHREPLRGCVSQRHVE